MELLTMGDALVNVSKAAGAILKDGFGSSFTVRSKAGRHNLVTEFDVRVESFLHERLTSLVPSSSFLGEEGGLREGTSDITWIVDPLDGTVNFAHGIPIFCVSIAAAIGDEIVAGVIHDPLRDETFHAVKGHGAFCNGRTMEVTTTDELLDSMLVTGFPYDVQSDPYRCIDQFVSLVRKGIPIRRLGSAALDLAYTADGRFDGFWEVHLQPWDMAAGVLLVTEAGGRVTQYGNAPFLIDSSTIIASNGLIHDELVSTLAEALPERS
jgi:myo-inositol-1(or 4)-monophosphatase